MNRSVPLIASTALTLLLLGQPVGSQTPLPFGDQGQINTYTTGGQGFPAVGVHDEGNFVVVWRSYGSWGSNSSHSSIQGRIFLSNGLPAGPEDQVNTFTTSAQDSPAVAVDTDGDFVVVWTSFVSDADEWNIRGQRYGSNGFPAGGEFQVNTHTVDYQLHPAVATDADGDFVVVWQSVGSGEDDSLGYSIQGQLYGSDGLPAGGEFQANTYTTDTQRSPEIGIDANDRFVVAWTSYGSGGSDDPGASVQGQRFEIPIFADGFESGDTSRWSISVP